MLNHTLTQKAYEYIHGKLSSGQLRPGSRLSNRRVAKEMGMSFTPVREALGRFVSEGLLEYRQGEGVFVPTSSAQEIRENYELREILESAAAAKACQNLQPAILAEMTDIHERMTEMLSKMDLMKSGAETNESISSWQAADQAFHRTLLCATNNRRLLNLVKSLRTSIQITQSGSQDSSTIIGHQFATEAYSHIKHTLEEHGQILKALKQGDAVAAKSVMAEHIRSGMELALASHSRHYMTTFASNKYPHASSG